MKAGWKCRISEAQLKERWASGERIALIAVDAGMTAEGLSKMAVGLGCKRRSKRTGGSTPEGKIALAKSLYFAGKGHTEIAKACGHAPSWSYNLAYRMKWVRLPPPLQVTKRCENCLGVYRVTMDEKEGHGCNVKRQRFAA